LYFFFYFCAVNFRRNKVIYIQGGPKNGTPIFCDNFRKCTPILTIFSLLEPEIYDA